MEAIDLTPAPHPVAAQEITMRRELGPVQLTFLGVGAIVGTGIFVLSGQVAAFNTGPAVILAFAFAGVAALLAALCYSEVASMVSSAGSAYAYARASLGVLVGWVIGWDLALEYLLAAASVSVAWSAYVVAFVENVFGVHLNAAWVSAPFAWDPQAGALIRTGGVINAPAMLVVGLLTVILACGVRESSRFNVVAVLIKVAVVLAFGAVAWSSIEPHNWTPFIPPNTGRFGAFGWSGILQGTSILFFAYNGFDAVSTAAPEAKRPDRDVPIAIVSSMLIAGFLYLIVAVVLIGVVPYAELGVPHPILVALERTQATWLQPAIEIGAIAGLTSVILVNLYSQPRVVFAMAADGLLPKPFAVLHHRFRTPMFATVCGGGVCAVGGGLFALNVLGGLMCVGTLFAFTVVSIGTIVLRLRRPHAHRSLRLPGGPWGIPLASTVVCGTLLAASQWQSIACFAVWLVVGLAIYVGFGRKNSAWRVP